MAPAKRVIDDCSTALGDAQNVLKDAALGLLKTNDAAVKSALVAQIIEASYRLEDVLGKIKQWDIQESSEPVSGIASVPQEKSLKKGFSSDYSDIDFPISFVWDGSLYKVGRKEKPNPDGTYGTWWKNARINEVSIILNAISAYPGETFRISDIRESILNQGILSVLPIYRVDVVFTALKNIGRLRPSTRGYYAIKSGAPDEWMREIQALEKRGDLLGSQK